MIWVSIINNLDVKHPLQMIETQSIASLQQGSENLLAGKQFHIIFSYLIFT